MIRYVYLIIAFCLFSVNSAMAQVNTRDYWIDKFLSCSFPLKSIKVNSSYGIRSDPFSGRHKRHNGLDLQARYEEVLSMFDGYVLRIGRDGGSGKYVIVQYGSYTVSYCHLSEIWVKEGQRILAGDPIGVSGSTGRSTGPHLHITSRLRGKLQDPMDLLVHVRDTKVRALRKLRVGEERISTPEEFVKAFADIAMRQQRKYGIPSSVILAQMAFESGWGSSPLAQVGLNYFGIKASRSWLSQGLPYSLHDDDKPGEKFCNFSSVEEGVDYHTKLLMSDRYARCWRYGPRDYHNWLLAIKAGGYATRKNYVSKVESIIKRYQLYKYDELAEKI